MSLWFAFALMTATAIFAVLWPLGRRRAPAGGSDLAVYRDQLEEIERDRAQGRIGEGEAEAAKVEVSRRLIAAADAAAADTADGETSSLWRRRLTAIAGLLLLPVGATVFYMTLGSPQLPGQPLAARLQQSDQDRSIETMVAQVEKHLERNPNDARGYEVIAPVYMRMGRFADAVNARRKVLALDGETAERQANLGEALAALASGVVTVEAKTAFERALALDAGDLKSMFYIGLAAEQDGDRAKAVSLWTDMLKDAPADAPWTPIVRDALTRVGATPPAVAAAPAPAAPATEAQTTQAPGPSAADMAAASQMSEQDRSDMIRGMVARLSDRLKEDGSDLAGWQRLLRAYMVLGERDKALTAAGDARKALANDPDKLRQLGDLMKSIGLDG